MLRLTVIADTHYYSKKLGTKGRQYELRSGSDQKCLAESGNIIGSTFEKIKDSDTQYVLIAGDLTNDGELYSHDEFRRKLKRLSKDKRVFAITSTHDWCNDLNARRFDGDNVYNDVKTLPPDRVGTYYYPFGPATAKSVFRTHIGTYSYTYRLNKKVLLLALNDDKNEYNHAGFTPEHLNWIKAQLKEAKRNDWLVIGMQHHLLMPHISPLITGAGTCISDRENIAQMLADAGLKFMIVGHSHIQSVAQYKSPSGNTLTEFNVGSLVGYPSPTLQISIDLNRRLLSYQMDCLEYFQMGDRMYDAQEYLKEHMVNMIYRVLDAPDSEEFGERLTALQLNGDKLKKLYPVIKPVMKLIRYGTVKELYNKLRLLGVSRFVDRDLVNRFADLKVISVVEQIMLSLFDGSRIKYGKYDDYYKLVMSFVRIPGRILKNNEDLKEFEHAIESILTGGEFDSQRGRFSY